MNRRIALTATTNASRTVCLGTRHIGTVISLTVLQFLCCCSRHNPTSVIPLNSPMTDSMHFQYAVYLSPKAPARKVDALAAVREVLKRFPDVKLVDEISAQPQGMVIHAYLEKYVKEKYPAPSVKSLRYSGRGLTPNESRELQQCTHALLLDFGHPKKYVWRGLRTANSIVDELVRQTGGFAWDDETREVFSAEAWHERRIASWRGEIPDVSDETVIHSYDNGRSVRAITLGMSKMGLPDVTINSPGWSDEGQMGSLINIFSQSLAEGKPIRETGEVKLDLTEIKNFHVLEQHLKSLEGNGMGVACLSLKPGQWEEGDPKNRLIQLGFDTYPGADDNAKQESMISSFFGSEDSISKVTHDHDEELQSASAKAKAKLPELQKAFAAGLEPGEFIDVKAPFKTQGGGNEWMWVEVTKWKGNEIEGVLENDPEDVPGLRAGQKVKVRQQDIFDYLRHFADKRTEGNTTGDIIRKMTKDEGGPNAIAGSATVPECND